MIRHVASNALSLFILGLFLLAGFIAIQRDAYYRAGPLTAGICLKVERGARVDDVTEKLLKAEAVTSALLFEIGLDYAGRSSDLKAGNFLIPAGASMADIGRLITASGRSTCGSEVVYRFGSRGHPLCCVH